MERTTSPDGTTIAYQRTGTGPPLLLVHGTTADHKRWASVVPSFERHFTVYAMDRRGRPASTDAADYHIMREAEDVAAVVDSIGDSVAVVGHSYGAVCCLEAALLTTGIGTMVLYEPPVPTGLPMYPPNAPGRIQSLVDADEPEAALEVFFREVVGMPEPEFDVYRGLPEWESRVRLAPTIARELIIDRQYEFDAARFGAVAVPTRLLLGGDSPPLFTQAVETVAAALRNSTVVVLQGQQHIAMDTAPDLFVTSVLEHVLG